MNLKKSINLALIEKDVKQFEIAKKMNVSPPYLSAIKHGKKALTIKRLKQISDAFGYKLSEFIALGE